MSDIESNYKQAWNKLHKKQMNLKLSNMGFFTIIYKKEMIALAILSNN